MATAAAALLLGPAATPASAQSCPNAAFRVGPSADLPGCRAYEQVTPSDKEASNDMFLNRRPGTTSSTTTGMAANRGGRVLLETSAAFGPSPDGFSANDYVFSRSQSGWRFTPVQPPGAGITHYSLGAIGLGVFSPDLSRVAPLSSTGSGTNPSPTLDLVFGAPGGPYTTIATAPPEPGAGPAFDAATPDFGHIFFKARDHSLVPAAGDQVAGSDALYEWVDGELRLVNRMSDGSLTSPCGAQLGGHHQTPGLPRKTQGSAHNAVSSDGSRAFFVSPDPTPASSDPSCDEPQRLFMRVNGTETVHVSEPDPGVEDPDGFQPVAFAGAAADGSRVFFITTTQLTADNPTHERPELYEYHVPSGDLTRVSRGASGDAEGNVQQALVSEDGSTVYFTAAGQLAPGAPEPIPPPINADTPVHLYRYDTATGTTRYIATMLRRNGDGVGGPGSSVGNWYTTPDGRFLVFPSEDNLTGYDPNSSFCQSHHSSPCSELYRYDSGDESLTCVSCPEGSGPSLDSAEFTGFAHGPTWSDIRPPRPISDDGSRMFFDTRERLAPGDSNDRRDVYEWHNGELSLISSGADAIDALFVDSSADGRDVFFGTHAQLAATDTDFVGDLYNARIGGGFPPPAGAAACSGEDCKAQPSSPPPATAPGTREGRPGNPGVDESRAQRCNRLDRRANKAKRKAKRLRKKAKQASGERAKQLNKRTKRARKKSKRLNRRANRCERRLERR